MHEQDRPVHKNSVNNVTRVHFDRVTCSLTVTRRGASCASLSACDVMSAVGTRTRWKTRDNEQGNGNTRRHKDDVVEVQDSRNLLSDLTAYIECADKRFWYYTSTRNVNFRLIRALWSYAVLCPTPAPFSTLSGIINVIDIAGIFRVTFSLKRVKIKTSIHT